MFKGNICLCPTYGNLRTRLAVFCITQLVFYITSLNICIIHTFSVTKDYLCHKPVESALKKHVIKKVYARCHFDINLYNNYSGNVVKACNTLAY